MLGPVEHIYLNPACGQACADQAGVTDVTGGTSALLRHLWTSASLGVPQISVSFISLYQMRSVIVALLTTYSMM
jgi:hypothetical protein